MYIYQNQNNGLKPMEEHRQCYKMVQQGIRQIGAHLLQIRHNLLLPKDIGETTDERPSMGQHDDSYTHRGYPHNPSLQEKFSPLRERNLGEAGKQQF